jgi:hypothetical protein
MRITNKRTGRTVFVVTENMILFVYALLAAVFAVGFMFSIRPICGILIWLSQL